MIAVIKVVPEYPEYWQALKSLIVHLFGYTKAAVTGAKYNE